MLVRFVQRLGLPPFPYLLAKSGLPQAFFPASPVQREAAGEERA